MHRQLFQSVASMAQLSLTLSATANDCSAHTHTHTHTNRPAYTGFGFHTPLSFSCASKYWKTQQAHTGRIRN